jgi:UDP-N-acetylmuramate dehydrogenase
MNKPGMALPVDENICLAPYTTLGVGGPAKFLIRARTEDQILEAIHFARAHSCPMFILGSGSNVIVSDDGFPGLVLKIELPGIRPFDDGFGTSVAVGAGVEWDVFVQYCVNRGFAGVECLSGIPGTVGGTPVQNVGAYGEEVSDVISGIRVLDLDTGGIFQIGSADCGFAYRSSIFNTICKERYIILKVDFVLRSDGKPRIHYPDLQRRFSGARVPSVGEVREAILQIRKAKAMVLVAGDPDCRSVGSFFKNPVLNPQMVAEVEQRARSGRLLGSSESIPRFPAAEGKEKVPAGWLIEHAGFHKGYARGNAGISSKHSLALVNRGGATAQDFLDLMHLIQARVHELFGVELRPEPVFIGFER